MEEDQMDSPEQEEELPAPEFNEYNCFYRAPESDDDGNDLGIVVEEENELFVSMKSATPETMNHLLASSQATADTANGIANDSASCQTIKEKDSSIVEGGQEEEEEEEEELF